MAWRIELSHDAEKQIAKLGHSTQREIRNYLRERLSLADDPRVFGKPLKGKLSGLWRYRVGKYRLICKIEDGRLVILVIAIGHRDGVYDE